MNTIQKYMRGLLDHIKEALAAIVQSVKNFIDTRFPGGTIAFTLVSLNIIGLIASGGVGLLFLALMSGMLACVSLAILYCYAERPIQVFILRLSKKGSWWLDLAITVFLTLLGFSMGPTMGLMGIMLGLNITIMFAIGRWIAEKDESIVAFSFSFKMPKFNNPFNDESYSVKAVA
jgi:hypothetical protein